MLLLLVRHGNTALTSTHLVGRTAGVGLDDVGRRQASEVAARLAGVGIQAIYTSPLERTRETAAPLAQRLDLTPVVEPGLNEIDYGEWAGRPFKELRRSELWKRVQALPGDVRFPGGEALYEAQARVATTVAELLARHPNDVVAAFSHSDLIKLAVMHFVGAPGDMLQRFTIEPTSVTAMAFGPGQPRLVKLNDTGSLGGLRARKKPPRRQVDRPAARGTGPAGEN